MIYGNRWQTQILYRDEIERMKGILDLETHFVLSEPEPGWQGSVGELTTDVLKACLGADDAGARYFVCGPAAMMDSVLGSLRDLGIPEKRLVTERFDLAAARGHAQSSNARLLLVGLAIILATAVFAFAIR